MWGSGNCRVWDQKTIQLRQRLSFFLVCLKGAAIMCHHPAAPPKPRKNHRKRSGGRVGICRETWRHGQQWRLYKVDQVDCQCSMWPSCVSLICTTWGGLVSIWCHLKKCWGDVDRFRFLAFKSILVYYLCIFTFTITYTDFMYIYLESLCKFCCYSTLYLLWLLVFHHLWKPG